MNTKITDLGFNRQHVCCCSFESAEHVRDDGATLKITRTIKDDGSENYDIDVCGVSGDRVSRHFGLSAEAAQALL